MLIQALQYCTNDAVNYAVANGQYCNTFRYGMPPLHACYRREEHLPYCTQRGLINAS
jgi:hypothetical protein